MKKKIADNSSFTNLKKKLEGLGKYSDNEVKKKLHELHILSETPDKFNDLFSEKGWVAHESMNYPLMKETIELAEQNKYDDAEQLIIKFYKEKGSHLLASLKQLEEIKPRFSLIYAAFQDYQAERYHACIPVFLMMIDGVYTDVINSKKSFFNQGAEVIAFDSIAGNESGLNNIANIFRKKRGQTMTKKITLPYRHGILHGRDLGYANEVVATKVFVTLIALKDWGIKYKEENSRTNFPYFSKR